MRNLVKYFFSKLPEDKHWNDEDISQDFLVFDQAFIEFSKGNPDMMSKELIEDLYFITYRDPESDNVFVGATTFCESDTMIKFIDPIVDLKIMPSKGIYFYEAKDDITYLSTVILYKIKNANRNRRNIESLDLKPFYLNTGKYPVNIIPRHDGDYTILTTDKEIYVVNRELEVKVNVTNKLKEFLPEEIPENIRIDYILGTADLVQIEFLDKNKDELIFANPVVKTWIYSISKNKVLIKLENGENISRVFNVDDPEEYLSKGYIMYSKTDEEALVKSAEGLKSEDDTLKMEAFHKMAEATRAFVTPLYHVRDDQEHIPINNSAQDLGGAIDSLNTIYIIAKHPTEEDTYIYRFLNCEDNKIVFEDVISKTIPRQIIFNPDTTVLQFKYELSNFKNIVSYWREYGNVIKYSKSFFKGNDLEDLHLNFESLKSHYEIINDNDITYSDEIAKIQDALDSKVLFEDPDVKNLKVDHICNTTTGDIDNGTNKIDFGLEGRIMTYTNNDQTIANRRITILDGSLDDFIKSEEEKNNNMIKDIKELREKGIIKDNRE